MNKLLIVSALTLTSIGCTEELFTPEVKFDPEVKCQKVAEHLASKRAKYSDPIVDKFTLYAKDSLQCVVQMTLHARDFTRPTTVVLDIDLINETFDYKSY